MTFAWLLNVLLEFPNCMGSLSYSLKVCSLKACQHRRLNDCITALVFSLLEGKPILLGSLGYPACLHTAM